MRKALNHLFAILATATAYFAVAWASGKLSADPVSYLPVWPAAGVALMGVFLFRGNGVLGVFLGSIASVTHYAIATGDVDWSKTPLLWIGLAACNAFQAWWCFRMLLPFVLKPERLVPRFALPKLLARSGLGIPLVMGFAAMLVLYLNGRMELMDLPLTALIWASGNAVGLLAFMPVAFNCCRKPGRLPRDPLLLTMMAGALTGVFVLLSSFYYMTQQDIHRVRTSMVYAGKQTAAQIEDAVLKLSEHAELFASAYQKDSPYGYAQDSLPARFSPLLRFNPALISVAMVGISDSEVPSHDPEPMMVLVMEPPTETSHWKLQNPQVDSSVRAIVLEAQATQRAVVSPFLEWAGVQGNTQGVIIAYPLKSNPIFAEHGFTQGSLILPLKTDFILGQAWNRYGFPRMLAKLHDVTEAEPVLIGAFRDGISLKHGSLEAKIERVEQATIYVAHEELSILGRTWHLTLVADESFYKRNLSQTSGFVTVGGFLLVLWVCYFMLHDLRSIHKVQEVVEKRTRELALARDEAEAFAKAKTDFLAVMSHEIRTPMNVIFGASDLLNETEMDEEQQQLAEIIQTSTKTLLSLINNILDFSKLDARRMSLNQHHGCLIQTCRSVLATIKPLAERKGLELHFDCQAEEPCMVEFDETKVSQILLNLLGNAVKFTHQGHVALNFEFIPEGDWGCATFRVRDTGIGIPESGRAKLFQVFSQLDNSDTRRYEGTGLGLAICSKLVDLLGGEVDFTSVENEGTEFRVYLQFRRIMIDEDPEPLEESVATSVSRSVTVLLVEDDSVNQKIASILLERMGCAVEICSDGQSALAKLESFLPDLVLMDCGLPGIDGYECTRRIRSVLNLDSLPIVALTAHAMEGDARKCLDAGMNDYLSKPIRKTQLEAILAKYVPDLNARIQGSVSNLDH